MTPALLLACAMMHYPPVPVGAHITNNVVGEPMQLIPEAEVRAWLATLPGDGAPPPQHPGRCPVCGAKGVPTAVQVYDDCGFDCIAVGSPRKAWRCPHDGLLFTEPAP